MSSHHAAPPVQTKVGLTVGLAVLGVFVTYIPIVGVSVALTTIARAAGGDTADLQWISDAYVIPMAAMVLSAGVFGDLRGRRRVYLLGMSLTLLGALVAATAGALSDGGSIGLLWAGQAISGLGGGLLLPTTLALVAQAVPDPRERGRFIGLWATGMMAGLALGPLVAGTVLNVASWGWIFVPTAVLALLAGLAAHKFLPESPLQHDRHLDWAGQLTASVAIAASIYGIIEGGAQGWSSTASLTGLIVGGLALIAFVVAELRSTSPLMDMSLFRSVTFSAAGFAALVALFSIVGAMFLLSLFLGYVQHLSPLGIGVRLIFVTGVGALVNPVVGAVSHRFKAMHVLALGLGLAAVGLGLLSQVSAAMSFADLAWRLALFGVSVSLMMTTVSTAAISSVPWQRAGMAGAANTAMRQYGGALGPAILGAVYSGRVADGASPAQGLETALIANATLLAVAALVCLVAGLRRDRTPTH